MATKILIIEPIHEEGLQLLTQHHLHIDFKAEMAPDELEQVIGEYTGLIIRGRSTVTARLLEHARRLKVIGRAGTGLDNIDVQAARKRGIAVVNALGANAVSVAEHTMALILALSRNIPRAVESVRRREWTKSRFFGTELRRKTLGLIGFGRVGTQVAVRAQAFGMRILAADPVASASRCEEMGVELVSLDELLGAADVISLHVPLMADTYHLIGRQELERMKPGALLINCARGEVLDEKALLEALQSGRLAGVALDVFEQEPPGDNPLLDLDNVIATPHIGGATVEAFRNVSVMVAEEVLRVLSTGNKSVEHGQTKEESATV